MFPRFQATYNRSADILVRTKRGILHAAKASSGYCVLRRKKLRFAFAFLLLLVATTSVCGQYAYLEEPQPVFSWPRLKYIKFDVEAEQANQSSSSTGARSQYERLYLAPALGIGWDYFVYHPDLLNFSILAEPGYVWQASGQPDALTHQNDLLLNGTLNATLLQLKPYASTLFANSSHNTHQYDFFNTVTEDLKSWGAITGYREGPVPVTVSFQQSLRDTKGFTYDSTSDQVTLSLHAQNERKAADITDLSYQYSEYHSTTSSSVQKFNDSSTFHFLTLTDTEHFNRSTLNSTLLFNETEGEESSADDLNINLDYSVEHTPHLKSVYDYSFSRFSTEGGESVQHYGRAGLQHQLYDSLASSVDIHGSSANNSYFGSSLDSLTAGTTASLNYSKRLGAWGHLSLGDSANYDVTEQRSRGSSLLIANESHALPSGQWVRLNQPRIIAIVSVTTDAAHGEQLLMENVDYIVDRTTDPWQIQISISSLLVHANDTVLVSYTVQPNPSGSYSVFSDVAQIRLDLWGGMVGLYGRYSFIENYTTDPGFVLEDVEELQAGADFNWRRLRLNANYTDRHSTLFDYYSYSLSESYSTREFAHSTLAIDLHQRWSFYPGEVSNLQNYKVTYYDYTLRYDWHPVSSINWSIEAGFQQQRGRGFDQDLFAARTYLNWLIGKLDIHLGYEYQNQKYIAEDRDRHFIFLRARRNF